MVVVPFAVLGRETALVIAKARLLFVVMARESSFFTVIARARNAPVAIQETCLRC